MTKREYFAEIRNRVADNEELVAFVDHEVELLDRKNSRKSGKHTKAQVANEGIKCEILEYLADNGHARIADIAEAVGQTPNKVNALVKQMKDAGTVVRTEEKRVAYFSIAE